MTIYQLGEDGDRQYLVMELVTGDPLDRLLAGQRFLAPEVALPLLTQMADALTMRIARASCTATSSLPTFW